MLRSLGWMLCTLACFALVGEPGRTRLRLCEDPWPPYTLGRSGEVAEDGIVPELVAEIADRMGLEAEVLLLPWVRCIKMVADGELDGVAAITRNEEREEDFVFSEPLLSAPAYVWFSAGKAEPARAWSGFEAFEGRIMGVTLGFHYGDAYQAALDEGLLNVQVAQTDEQNFAKLARGRIDFFICNDWVARYLIQGRPEWREAFEHFEKPVDSYDFHLAILRDSPLAKRMGELNQVIADLHAEGVVGRIVARRLE